MAVAGGEARLDLIRRSFASKVHRALPLDPFKASPHSSPGHRTLRQRLLVKQHGPLEGSVQDRSWQDASPPASGAAPAYVMVEHRAV